MSITRAISYNRVTDGIDLVQTVSVEAAEVDVGGTTKPCLIARVPGGGVVAFDVTDHLESIVDGKESGIFGGLTGTYLSAYEAAAQTTLSVDDDDGFADGDPVAIFNSEGDTPEYRLVSGTPTGNVITVNAGLTAEKFKGAFVVNLSGREFGSGRGYAYNPGARTMLEAPRAVTIAVVDGTGDTIDVTITPNDEGKTTHYDIYVRAALFNRIEPNWVPDLADQTSVASALTVSTHGGGSNCVPDGTGGNLAALGTYYVAAIAKRGAGQHGVVESPVSNVVEFTLD